MKKLGVYIQRQADAEIEKRLRRLQPAVAVVHLDGGELIPWIRRELPECFVIGRYWWSPQDQERALYHSGASLAGLLLAQKAARQCQAMMLFNEFLTSPYDAGWESVPGKPDKPRQAGWRAMVDRYDALQVQFREALLAEGIEAVAWNYGAGNWARMAWYERLQPLTYQSYQLFGYHVYGWPRLVNPEPWWLANLAETLAVCDARPDRTHIITELAVTRMYAGQGPDRGWLSQPDPIALDDYAGDLAAVNELLNQRPHVLGAALFNAAPLPDWQTMAITDDLTARLETLPGAPAPEPEKPQPAAIRLRLPFAGTYRLTQGFGENPAAYKPFGLAGHEGIDWALPLGTEVLAAADGVVDRVDTVDAGNKRTDPYGLSVRIKHAWGWSYYAHLSRVDVRKDDKVRAGDRVGLSGSTGNSEGPHLHFSIKPEGADERNGYLGRVDPAPYLVTTPAGGIINHNRAGC